jgi:hypothetical protein
MFAIANFSRLIMACLERIGTEVSGPLDGKTLLGEQTLLRAGADVRFTPKSGH